MCRGMTVWGNSTADGNGKTFSALAEARSTRSWAVMSGILTRVDKPLGRPSHRKPAPHPGPGPSYVRNPRDSLGVFGCGPARRLPCARAASPSAPGPHRHVHQSEQLRLARAVLGLHGHALEEG